MIQIQNLMSRKVLIIGSGGLLGSSLEKMMKKSSFDVSPPMKIDWSNQSSTELALRSVTNSFLSNVGSSEWVIAWCAGSYSPNSLHNNTHLEKIHLNVCLDEISKFESLNRGLFLFSSSAGAIYQNVIGIATELTVPSPVTEYGIMKLESENLIREWASRKEINVLIARISTLYGEKQNINKPQGLISHLCHSVLVNKPVMIYASSDSKRDYLYVDDCSTKLINCISKFKSENISENKIITKIIASFTTISPSQIIGILNSNIFRRPKYIFLPSNEYNLSNSDNRFNSVIWKDVDEFEMVSLQIGISKVLAYTRFSIQ